MSVSNYIQKKKYLIKDLDNYIYLFPFNEPILNYITDDGTSNASASDIMGSGYEVYCENVSYNSNASIDNRFSFEHTLTLTILDISTSLLNHFMMNKWMVLFKNKSGDIFVLNAEYPIDVTYQYNVNDENTPNSLTITLKSLSNIPIIKFGDIDLSDSLPLKVYRGNYENNNLITSEYSKTYNDIIEYGETFLTLQCIGVGQLKVNINHTVKSSECIIRIGTKDNMKDYLRAKNSLETVIDIDTKTYLTILCGGESTGTFTVTITPII